MLKKRVAVLVSGGGTNLQALIDYEKNKKANYEIVLVVSNNEEAYALQRAKQNKIETVVIAKNNLQMSQEEWEEKLIKKIEEKNIELIVLAGFLSILSENFTSKYPNKIINVHPSLIPAFCGKGYYGLKVHKEVLKAGVKVTGATVHFVNEVPDGGKIIAQKAVEVKEGDTPETLQKRVMEEAEWKILPEAVNEVCKSM